MILSIVARPYDQENRNILGEFISMMAVPYLLSLLTSLAKDTPACFLPHVLALLVVES